MTTVLTTTATTTTKRRDPLTTINMATTQARPAPSTSGGTGTGSAGTKGRGRGRRANETDENANKLAERKRKPGEFFFLCVCDGIGIGMGMDLTGANCVGYDEDVEGFQFSRLPAKKTRSVEPAESAPAPAPTGRKDTPKRGRHAPSELRLEPESPAAEDPAPRKKGRPSRSKADRNGFVSPEPDTKITLPMADTPVMQRNKDMRTAAKSEKGNRRSSLGMRGRRASSLIDSGASNGEFPPSPRINLYGLIWS